MVLFLCVLLGVIVFLICLFRRITLRFWVQVTGGHICARAQLCLLFGLIRIPAYTEETILSLLKKKWKRKRPKKKVGIGRIIWQARKREGVKLKEFACRGVIGHENDAFISVMAAGAAQSLLTLALRAIFPAGEQQVAFRPAFEQNVFWLYMEGILEIAPTQIIGNLLDAEKTRRR